MKKLILNSIAVLVLISASIPLPAQGLSEKLKFLEPLLGAEWRGEMPLPPDGKKSAMVTLKYEALWEGQVVHYTRSIPELKFFAEGYFHWDEEAQQVSLWVISSRGGASQGKVTLEEGKITVAGQMSMQQRRFDYRNTFEFSADGRLIDRWFQNAMGPWKPGHTVTFIRNK